MRGVTFSMSIGLLLRVQSMSKGLQIDGRVDESGEMLLLQGHGHCQLLQAQQNMTLVNTHDTRTCCCSRAVIGGSAEGATGLRSCGVVLLRSDSMLPKFCMIGAEWTVYCIVEWSDSLQMG